ncbi:hypothetical protein SPRG_20549 [Saprolegnia parasitica CBS 223.65]|uniref:Uncharacterized protein n=1 Tax=Saprolegnia parasitica (strain CBS 223.65) TaxID=695850 RepID=A0A067CIY6_SAPPC|nr:hypothetical protein SPRG_20549 [Saprolegnia parasitica CBS 223.65]KDO26752.1 hypothetical protein SPRG_20549 [Saprolegnia parasitica CBS 223.65]|eukprot:XP_012202631.1 hypothetical protein SPRG_20549 [Saprolegnia parasitica CBS 223.65]
MVKQLVQLSTAALVASGSLSFSPVLTWVTNALPAPDVSTLARDKNTPVKSPSQCST